MSHNPHDLDRVTEGSEVYVNYENIQDIVGIVRKVIHRKEGVLSVRVPLVNIPENQRRAIAATWVVDPRDPSMIPVYLAQGEWKLKSGRLYNK